MNASELCCSCLFGTGEQPTGQVLGGNPVRMRGVSRPVGPEHIWPSFFEESGPAQLKQVMYFVAKSDIEMGYSLDRPPI